MATTKKASNHYVDNVKFLEAMGEFRNQVLEAKAKGLKRHDEGWPVVTNYIGECILKIAIHYSYKPNFSGYSFREEMISDAVENCLKYADNFDPEKGKNPFAYFTQITFYAFLRRIEKEKEELVGKYKYIASMNIEELLAANGEEGEVVNQYITYLQEQIDNSGALADKPKKSKNVTTKAPKSTQKAKKDKEERAALEALQLTDE
jgi:hypothetical protein